MWLKLINTFIFYLVVQEFLKKEDFWQTLNIYHFLRIQRRRRKGIFVNFHTLQNTTRGTWFCYSLALNWIWCCCCCRKWGVIEYLATTQTSRDWEINLEKAKRISRHFLLWQQHSFNSTDQSSHHTSNHIFYASLNFSRPWNFPPIKKVGAIWQLVISSLKPSQHDIWHLGQVFNRWNCWFGCKPLQIFFSVCCFHFPPLWIVSY